MQSGIRPITHDELLPWLRTLETAAGRQLRDEVVEDAGAMYELDRTLAAFDGGRIVGGTASELLELTVPGPVQVPATRITLTAVLPMYRRRGIATALFAHQVADLRRRGEPLAIFTTTGPGLYRRVGYSPASVAVEVEIETALAALERPLDVPGGIRLLEPDELAGTLPGIFDRHRARQPGQVARTAAFWRIWLLDRRQFRRSEPGDRFAAVYEEGGTAQGYLTYRLREGAARDQPIHTLVVEDLVAVTDDARRALWAYCLGMRQAVLVTAPNVPSDEPVGWMLADPRLLRTVRVRDFLWLRVLDVPAALAARRYDADGTVVLEIADPTCRANDGRFRLTAAAGAGACEATAAAPDVGMGVDDLAAGYLGGVSFTTLARAGRVRELTPGAVRRCDRMFASRPAPWTVTDW